MKPQATREIFTADKIATLPGYSGWAILSAENPHGKRASEEENHLNHKRLLCNLVRARFEWVDLDGVYSGIPEHSVAILGIAESHARMLCRIFGQESFITDRGLNFTGSNVYLPLIGVTAFPILASDAERGRGDCSTLPDTSVFRLTFADPTV